MWQGVQALFRVVCGLALALTTAHAAPAASLLDFSADERERILSHGPWPMPPPRDPSNGLEGRPQAIRFGQRLFADRRLSPDGRVSCADCHRPSQAFSDRRSTAAARRGDGPRNTPSLWDVAQQRWFGWGGATDSLWAASLVPLLAADEMAHAIPALAARVRATPDLARGWQRAHGRALPQDDEAVVVGLAKALAAWQATHASPRTRFDRFRDALARGDHKAAAAFPMAAQRGLRLFIGEARCSVCHSGPRFSNGEFADIGLPFFLPGGTVDSGRHAGLLALQASAFTRLGRHHDGRVDADARALLVQQLTMEPRHFGEFRVPGLRQLRHTAPFWHDGSAATLAEVVRHYSRLDEDRLHADGERVLRRLNLNPQQAADLEAFLLTLSTAPLRAGVQGVSGGREPSGGASAGSRNRSSAQSPRSPVRQRWLQKGRQGLAGANKHGWRQRGQGTRRAAAVAGFSALIRRTGSARSGSRPRRPAGVLRRRAS